MYFDDYKGIEFYTLEDDVHTIFAEYIVPKSNISPEVKKLININNPDFASFLRIEIIPSLDEKKSAQDIIREVKDTIAVYGCPDKINTKVRIAGKLKSGVIEYALYNNKRQCVQVNENDWYIVDEAKYKFVDNERSKTQVKPLKSDKNLIKLLKPYINTNKESLLLLIVWLVQAFCEGNHSMLILSSNRGTGKSTLTKIIRRILDPSSISATTMQEKSEGLLNVLTNSYFVDFDNVREFGTSESDILCTAITSGTYTKREAYTTNQMAVYPLHNTIIMNGIDLIPSESDLAQRCLMIRLKPIDDDKRKTEDEILMSFERDLPYILGLIFDTLSKAMTIIKSSKPEIMPRMSDSYFEMLPIAVALGIDEDTFERIYFKNIAEVDRVRSNTDLVYAVREYMNTINGRSVEGTVSQIYTKIYGGYTGNKSALPKSASQFSRRLNAEHTSFLAAGYVINIDDTYADGTHIKIIKK